MKVMRNNSDDLMNFFQRKTTIFTADIQYLQAIDL